MRRLVLVIGVAIALGSGLVHADEQATAPDAPGLIGPTWVLTNWADGVPAHLSEDSQITARFGIDTDRRDKDRYWVSGFAGCNTYWLQLHIANQAITQIAMPVSSMKACSGLMEQESKYLGVLTRVASCRISGSRLELLDEQQKPLVVFRSTPTPATTEPPAVKPRRHDGPPVFVPDMSTGNR